MIVVFGSRLGLQQTGFNWQEWGRNATVVQVDIDPAELAKGHPHVEHPLCADANAALETAVAAVADAGVAFDAWLAKCRKIRELLPLIDPANVTGTRLPLPVPVLPGPRREFTTSADTVIPCSSGGAQLRSRCRCSNRCAARS